MKKLIVVAVIVVAAVVLIRAKIVERDRNYQAAEDYFISVCGSDQACADRLIRFRPCFAGAYRMSLVPGGDTVDVDHLVDSLNGKHPVAKLNAVRSVKVPFPSISGS